MRRQKEVITSRNNSFVKLVASLKDKKGREEARSFLAEGIKLTKEALCAGVGVSHVIVNEGKLDKYLPQITEAAESCGAYDTELVVVSESVFEKISTEKAPEGVISVIKYLDFFQRMDIIYKEDFFLKQGQRAIILSSVRDPSNLGSVIRSAVAFGAEHIILSEDCADLYNPKTVRSAMGSLFKVAVTAVSSFSTLIDALHAAGRRVYSAELREGAISLSELDVRRDDCFIIGNEGHGIAEEISQKCDGSVYIPISSRTESLNASVAAALFMWEQSRI